MTSCAFVLRPTSLPTKVGRTSALSSKYKIDETDFTDWRFFLSSNLMAEISFNPESLDTNT